MTIRTRTGTIRTVAWTSFAAAAVALAPSALADDPAIIPEAGSESAAATISDLQAAGYDVRTQFENGDPTVALDQCDVTDINTVGSAGTDQLAYVTITCPSNPS